MYTRVSIPYGNITNPKQGGERALVILYLFYSEKNTSVRWTNFYILLNHRHKLL